MSLSLVYGSAFQTSIRYDDHLRLYRYRGKTYLGYDTTDIAHVCDETCMRQVIDGTTFAPTDDDSHVFVNGVGATRDVATIDVVDFDPGDDPYVLCAACGAELLRDDDKFFEEYGRRIGESS